ncbi:MAG TPA: hypothetical protein VFX68_07015 [Sulfuricurvum sp.]|nr:hypothetical protein [Sulfuricurvum sp.]
MSKNTMRERLLEQLIQSPKVEVYQLPKIIPSTRKGQTLADFYTEVFQSSKPLYESKSAKELEIMMIKNRQLIEAKNKKR